jgi:UDP-glucose 4-epimerase
LHARSCHRASRSCRRPRRWLLAAEAAGVTRMIHFSSAQVFGIAEAERLPDYFPVDDAHPRRAMRAYGLSKCLAEDLCAGFTARTGIASVSLCPVWVWDPGQYQRTESQWRSEPSSEWEPFWEFGGSWTCGTSSRQWSTRSRSR